MLKQPQLLLAHIAGRVMQWPRLGRLALVFAIALLSVAMLFPFVDDVYIRNFFDPATVIVPSFVSALLGCIIYFVGWYVLLLGELNSRRALYVQLYLAYGLGVFLITISLILFGLLLAALANR